MLLLTPAFVHEIIVVENEPEDPSYWRITGASRRPVSAAAGVRFMRSRPGAAAARNVGWQAAGSEWVLFLDDDVLPAAQTLPAIEALLSCCYSPGVIGLRVLTAAGPHGVAATVTSLDRGVGRRVSRGPIPLFDAWQFGCGAALVVHRQLLLATGGFKERLGAGRHHGGAEDLEFLWHASLHGIVAYDGTIEVIHEAPRSIRSVSATARQYGRALGLLAGTAKTRESVALVHGYCAHLLRAAAPSLRGHVRGARERSGCPTALLLAGIDTLGAFLWALFREPTEGVLCRTCRRGD